MPHPRTLERTAIRFLTGGLLCMFIPALMQVEGVRRVGAHRFYRCRS